MEIFPELQTKRLILGTINASYITEIVKQANNKNISDNTLNLPYPYKEADATFWIQMQKQGFNDRKNYIFAIHDKMKSNFLGGVGLHLDPNNNKAELGYWIGESFWNNGFATEAVEEILKFGFNTLGLNKIFATYFLSNSASEKVLQKVGMNKEAHLKSHYLKNGEYRDVGVYCLLKNEYKNRL